MQESAWESLWTERDYAFQPNHLPSQSIQQLMSFCLRCQIAPHMVVLNEKGSGDLPNCHWGGSFQWSGVQSLELSILVVNKHRLLSHSDQCLSNLATKSDKPWEGDLWPHLTGFPCACAISVSMHECGMLTSRVLGHQIGRDGGDPRIQSCDKFLYLVNNVRSFSTFLGTPSLFVNKMFDKITWLIFWGTFSIVRSISSHSEDHETVRKLHPSPEDFPEIQSVGTPRGGVLIYWLRWPLR